MTSEPEPPVKTKPSPLATAALVASNLIPLVGVAAFGWDVRSLLALYWAENIVVAIWAIARMLRVGGIAVLPMAAFFCVHFGIFTLVHGVFVGAMTSDEHMPGPLSLLSAVPPLALLGLFVSHGVSFVSNFLIGGEWRKSNAAIEMAKPYPRMVVLHVAIVLAGFAIFAVGQRVVLLVLLVVFKTALDLGVHVVGHRIRLNTGDATATTPAASWPATPPSR